MNTPTSMHRTARPGSRRRHQRGVVLAMSLVLLAILSLVGLYAMRGSILGEQVSKNIRANEVASQAAPYDEIPQLDLVAIAAGEGRFHEADRILRTEITNRTDDDTAPTDPSQRATAIIESHSKSNPYPTAVAFRTG